MLAAFYGLFALIFMPFIIFTIIGSLAGGNQNGPSAVVAIGSGLAMAVLFPVFYAIMGFFFGAIGAWIYNLLARWIGGIQVEVE